MKVLSTPSWSTEVTCSGCKSVLLVEPADISGVSYRSGISYHFVTCPVCGRTCRLRDLPTNVTAMVENAYYGHKR